MEATRTSVRSDTFPVSLSMVADNEGLDQPGDAATEAPGGPVQQPPLVAVIEGGNTIDFDQQERSAWEALADACVAALTVLHPRHPERYQFQVMLQECRRASGRPTGLALLQKA